MKTLTERDILQYLQHLLMLIDSGIPLSQATQLLTKQTHSHQKRQLFKIIHQMILSGNGFTKTLENYSCFSPLIIQLCKIGEDSGTLNQSLRYATEWLEKKIAFKDQIKQLTFYPFLLLISALILLFIILVTVVPQFALLFKDHLKELPILTLIIFKTSAFVIQYGKILFMALCLLLIITLKWRSMIFSKINRFLKIWIFKLPAFKQYEDYFCIVHFTQALSMSLQAGTPLSQALTLSFPPFLSNRWKNPLTRLAKLILTGVPLHQLLNETKLFPIDIIESIYIGEESHTLEKILKELSNFYEKKLQHLLKRIVMLSEPFIMLSLGIIIGIVVIGLYLPIFRLGNTF